MLSQAPSLPPSPLRAIGKMKTAAGGLPVIISLDPSWSGEQITKETAHS